MSYCCGNRSMPQSVDPYLSNGIFHLLNYNNVWMDHYTLFLGVKQLEFST